MKFIFCIAFALTLMFHHSHGASATWGQRGPNDQLLRSERIVRPSLSRSSTKLQFDYPAKGQRSKKVITAIYVLDQFRNSSGAIANLNVGGVGRSYATLNLKSQRGYGVDTIVNIYGH